jgi:hypothetical protein
MSSISGASATRNSSMATSAAAGLPLFVPGIGAAVSSTATTVTSKKSRQTSKQAQFNQAIKAKAGHRDKLAMKQATILIVRNNTLPHDHANKRTIVEIVSDTNERLIANVSGKKTAAHYVRNGLVVGVSLSV